MGLLLEITSTDQEQEKDKGISLSMFLQTDEEMREEALRTTKAGVADLGWYSCHILIGFIFQRDNKEILEIFRRFRKYLERRIKPHYSYVVLDGIFALLKTGEELFRSRQEPNPSTMKLKGEAHQSWVFTPQEKFNVWSMLGRLCDQIIFMEDMVKRVMSQKVGVETMRHDIQECMRCLQSMHMVVSSRISQMTPWLIDENGSEYVVMDSEMTARNREIWSRFEL